MSRTPHVLVVDDDASFVSSLVRAFKLHDVDATGCSEPAKVLGWQAREHFAFDLILLDMRLGRLEDGTSLSALKLLPHLMTYAPSSKVVVFSQEDMTVEEALRCVELGALTVVPKGSQFGELCRVAEVYERLGDRGQTREELIRVLWDDIKTLASPLSGKRLEMLVINIFESMPTFRVVGNNVRTSAGNIDVLVENQNVHPFWDGLVSTHLVVECKNRKRPPGPAELNQLKDLVKSRRLCGAGILVSTSAFSGSFDRRRDEIQETSGLHLFGVGLNHLERMVETPFDEREAYLRSVLEAQ